MLHDATWCRFASKNETLCGNCVLQRAINRKVPITLADLRPCPLNLFRWPRSWFNFFAGRENPPTFVSAKWRKAAAGARKLDHLKGLTSTDGVVP
jgi:hypothetical protein